MGCTHGKNAETGERCEGAAPTETPAKGDKLLDKYMLGKVLGQGAFGVVYSCKKRGTKDEFAVKMIDQVETPVAEIKLEVDMLKKLEHPTVVKLHDVFYEKVFVCMVLEIYRGGDMIEGMQHHWKQKGMIPIPTCQNMSKMMFQSIDWLHSNHCIHRDLKGDNYLQDRREIEHPTCRIYLSDFGTVAEMKPGSRMKSRCGTKTYWGPEFYALNYGLKVDIWALGVVIFGMITGRFPFKGEDDVLRKTVKCPSRCGKQGEEFVLKTLEREEEKRLSAKEALDHPFLSTIRSAAESDMEKMDPNFKAEVREQGANAGIKERRRELVERLELAQGRPNQINKGLSVKEQLTKGFKVQDERDEVTTAFEWWSEQKVGEASFYNAKEAKVVSAKDGSSNVQTAAEIEQSLKSHSCDPAKFGIGQAKSFDEFVQELHNGQARLMLDASKFKNQVRVVDVVLLRIVYGEGVQKRVLVKVSEKYPDGRMRENINQLVGTKKSPEENGRQTALRLIQERLPQFTEALTFDFTAKECFEDDEDSPSYPGMRTIYRKEIYEGVVTVTDSEALKKLALGPGTEGKGEFSQTDSSGYVRQMKWLTEAECKAKGIKLTAPSEGSELSALVMPPIGYEEEDLKAFLTKEVGDLVEQFGKDGNKSLAEFSEELVKGEATLQKIDGTLRRVVDVVILEIFNFQGDTLVEVSHSDATGTVKKNERLPAVKRRADENPFWAAHRVLNKVLKISENLVELDPNKVRLVEELSASKGFAGIKTLYRRRIIPAKVVKFF